ncbi:MAG: DUF4190 domain-containing protein [Phycisphaerales bacterium]
MSGAGGAAGGARPGGPQPGYEAWYEEPRESRLSVMAVLSLVFSILCLTAPLGVILGVAALFAIGASRGRTHGKGLAVSGVVIGIICSTCLTFALVGGIASAQFMNQNMLKPTGQMMTDIDAEDYAAARTKLLPGVGAAITDEQFAEFRAAYRDELGAFKKTPDTLWEMMSGFSTLGGAMSTFSKDIQAVGQGNNIIPVRGDFENGPAMVGVHVDPTGGRASGGPGPGQMMPLDNLVIVTNRGTIIWLRDPRAIPIKGTIPGSSHEPSEPAPGDTPPPPAHTPETPPGG